MRFTDNGKAAADLPFTADRRHCFLHLLLDPHISEVRVQLRQKGKAIKPYSLCPSKVTLHETYLADHRRF
jgi:hypothetical protein